MIKYTKVFTIGIVLAAIASPPSLAVDNRGLELATEVDIRDHGFQDNTAKMKMILRNRSGSVSVRNMRIKSLEVEGDGDKSLSIFDEPADVKGTASLTWSHATVSDDQWLYLPALKRVKRISSKNKSGPFMGSEFAFEDIGSQEVDKYTYSYVGEDSLDGIATHIIERYPVDKYSGYRKQIVWIEQERYIALKIEYYDRKGSLLKTMTASDFEQYLEKHWRAAKMEMVNHQSGKSTTLEFTDFQFKTGLKDKDFQKTTLGRLR